MPLDNTYYVYIAKFFDTPASIANRFYISEQELRAANPQWATRLMVFLDYGEEVILPDAVENAPLFFLFRGELLVKKRKALDKKPKTYPPNWFPPKPDFGSPSVPIAALLKKLGNPKYKVNSPGVYHSPITFLDGWEGKNVSRVFVSQLKGVNIPVKKGFVKCDGNISFYNKAHKAIKDLFKAWDDGLLSKILTYDRSFVPRVIGSTTTPSNHSFGTAIDLNAAWNGQGSKPAAIGKKGCLLELVPRATELGFYWGGFYSVKSIDGKHFEYAKL